HNSPGHQRSELQPVMVTYSVGQISAGEHYNESCDYEKRNSYGQNKRNRTSLPPRTCLSDFIDPIQGGHHGTHPPRREPNCQQDAKSELAIARITHYFAKSVPDHLSRGGRENLIDVHKQVLAKHTASRSEQPQYREQENEQRKQC